MLLGSLKRNYQQNNLWKGHGDVSLCINASKKDATDFDQKKKKRIRGGWVREPPVNILMMESRGSKGYLQLGTPLNKLCKPPIFDQLFSSWQFG